MTKAVVFLTLLGIVTLCEGKKFNECQLAKELLRNGIPHGELSTWMCIIHAESRGDTAAKGGPDWDGSYNHGLFQINDNYWCSNGRKGKGCNVRCEDLRSDDVSMAVACAKAIQRVQGFGAWAGYNLCKTNPKRFATAC